MNPLRCFHKIALGIEWVACDGEIGGVSWW
jgi:hypothetical protein